MLNDDGEKIDPHLLNSFIRESSEVIENLKSFLAEFTEPSQNECFEKFGQQVDRVMGAAFTLSLNEMGELCRLGKELGYKSSQVSEISKLLTVQSLLSQLVKILENILKSLKSGQREKSEDVAPLLKRMTEASAMLGNLRTSVKV